MLYWASWLAEERRKLFRLDLDLSLEGHKGFRRLSAELYDLGFAGCSVDLYP